MPIGTRTSALSEVKCMRWTLTISTFHSPDTEIRFTEPNIIKQLCLHM